MKIALRLSEPVTDVRHQQYILGAAARDVGGSLALYGDGEVYFPSNPFKFNAEGTAVEADLAKVSVSDRDIQAFKRTSIESMNAGLRGNTTKAYEPAPDFPKVQVKVMEVGSEIQR